MSAPSAGWRPISPASNRVNGRAPKDTGSDRVMVGGDKEQVEPRGSIISIILCQNGEC